MATLQKLAENYDSSEDESDTESVQTFKKRKLETEGSTEEIKTSKYTNGSDSSCNTRKGCERETLNENQKQSPRYLAKSTDDEQPLPVPQTIIEMFQENDLSSAENPSEHGGRIRSFPHLPGNWATHVYIPVKTSEVFQDMMKAMVNSLDTSLSNNMQLFPLDELHLSLSRTVPIRHYWIQPIVDQLRAGFSNKKRFFCSLGFPEFYTNDEKTRSFLGLTVSCVNDEMEELVAIVDDLYREFGLQEFYMNPSFHVSISWCLGDIQSKVTDAVRSKLKDIFYCHLELQSSMSVLNVTEIHCKIGNKLFKFPLR